MRKMKRLAITLMVFVMAMTALTSISFASDFVADSAEGKQITSENVTVNNTGAVYNGKAQIADVSVVVDGVTLKRGTDYKLVTKTITNAGKTQVIVVGIGEYAGFVEKSFSVAKATDKTVSVKASASSFKYSKSKARKATIKISNKKANSTVSYKVTKYPKKASKYIKVSKSGTVTLKKGAKKGTYQVKVTITNPNYKTVTKTITIKVK